MLKLKLQYSGHLMRRVDSLEKTLMLGGIGGKRRRGRQRMRWLDGICSRGRVESAILSSDDDGNTGVLEDGDGSLEGLHVCFMLIGFVAQFVQRILDGKCRPLYGEQRGEVVLSGRTGQTQRAEQQESCEKKEQGWDEDHEKIGRKNAFGERDVADMEHGMPPSCFLYFTMKAMRGKVCRACLSQSFFLRKDLFRFYFEMVAHPFGTACYDKDVPKGQQR